MRESIFGHLETSLHTYLDSVTHRATTGDDIRADLPRVIAALQALLDEHRPDAAGRCRTCRTKLFTRAPSPCRAYLTAHLCLLVTEETQAQVG